MKIPPYWVREKRVVRGREVKLFGASFDSIAAAQASLAERARLWEAYLAQPSVSPAVFADFTAALRALAALPGEDTYSAAVLEPVIAAPDEQNLVTRNRYGALVLNSTSLCFVDVDHFRGGGLLRFLGLGKKPEQLLLEAAEKLCRQDDSLSARVYRTARGWRVALQGQGLSLGSAREAQLFLALQADPLYVNLCRKQACWRARLSPKPFHMGLPRFPYLTDSTQAPQQMAAWVEQYEARTAPYAVCRLLDAFGPAWRSPILELHDSHTRALTPDLPLA